MNPAIAYQMSNKDYRPSVDERTRGFFGRRSMSFIRSTLLVVAHLNLGATLMTNRSALTNFTSVDLRPGRSRSPEALRHHRYSRFRRPLPGIHLTTIPSTIVLL